MQADGVLQIAIYGNYEINGFTEGMIAKKQKKI